MTNAMSVGRQGSTPFACFAEKSAVDLAVTTRSMPKNIIRTDCISNLTKAMSTATPSLSIKASASTSTPSR